MDSNKRNRLPVPAYIASLAPKDAEDAKRLVARVPAAANAIEFRMDLAESPIPPAALLSLDSRPMVLTWRSLAEGGNFSGSAEEYARRILSSLSLFLLRLPRDGVVILLNSVDDLTVERGRIHISGVCSPIVTRGAA